MTLHQRPRVLGVGSPIIDLLARVPEAFMAGVPGEKGGMELLAPEEMDALIARLPEPPQRAPGGSAANTICALARLGIPGALLGMMGEDDNGAFYCREFAAIGGDCACIKTSKALPTGRCLSLITPDGERTMRTDLGAAVLLRPDDLSPKDFEGYTLVHLEGYALFDDALTRRVLELAKAAQCTVSLDLGSFEVVRAVKATLPSLLRDYVDIVFANEDEARSFCGAEAPEAGLDALAPLCNTAAVKIGPRGAWIQHGPERVFAAALTVTEVTDTTGAGDCWAAGLLYGLLMDLPLEACGRLAALIGAETVQCLGASPEDAGWHRITDAVSSLSPLNNT